MDFVKHLFRRSRQRVTQEVKPGGDSQWRSRFLSEVWDLLEIRLLVPEPFACRGPLQRDIPLTQGNHVLSAGIGDLHAFWQLHFAGSDSCLNAISSNNDGVIAQRWL